MDNDEIRISDLLYTVFKHLLSDPGYDGRRDLCDEERAHIADCH